MCGPEGREAHMLAEVVLGRGLGGMAGRGIAEFVQQKPVWGAVLLAMLALMAYWLIKYVRETEDDWL